MRHLAFFVLCPFALVAAAGCQNSPEPIRSGSIVAEGRIVTTDSGEKFVTREFSHDAAGKWFFDLYDATPGKSERIDLKKYANMRMRVSTTGMKGDALADVRILQVWEASGVER